LVQASSLHHPLTMVTAKATRGVKRNAAEGAAPTALTPEKNSKLPWSRSEEPLSTLKEQRVKAPTGAHQGKRPAPAELPAIVEPCEQEEAHDDAEAEDHVESEDQFSWETRVTMAKDAWVSSEGESEQDLCSAQFHPETLAERRSERLPFSVLAAALDVAGHGPQKLRALTNMFRRVLVLSADAVGDLESALEILLCKPMPQRIVQPTLIAAVSVAFGLKGMTCAEGGTKLANTALAARKRQRTLFQPKPLQVSEVASVIKEYEALRLPHTKASTGLADHMKQLLGRSITEARGTWHLVQILQCRSLPSPKLVLRALAHAFVLQGCTIKASADNKGGEARAEEMVHMEDAIESACAQRAQDTRPVVSALLAGTPPSDLVEKCSPVCGTQVKPMTASASASATVQFTEALETFAGSAVLAEWMLFGDRAQIHVTDECASVQVFTKDKGLCVERSDEVASVLRGNLRGVNDAIFEVMLMQPPRSCKATMEVSNAQSPKKQKASTSGDVEMKEKASTSGDVDMTVASSTSESKETAPTVEGKEATVATESTENRDANILKELSGETQMEAVEAGGAASTGEPSAASPSESSHDEKVDQATQALDPCLTATTVIIFDVLLINGQPMTQFSLRERREKLQAAVPETTCLKFPRSREIVGGGAGAESLKSELDEALGAYYVADATSKASSRARGIVLKRLDGPSSRYFAGRTSSSWQAVQKPHATGAEAENLLFQCLNEKERACLPDATEFHFCVISARRTQTAEGRKDVLNVQSQLVAAGATPCWYVDAASLEGYKELGLNAVVGGKLIPARNMALEDASKLGKACVQVSDDIARWDFYRGDSEGRHKVLAEANAAYKRAEQYQISPVSAARFLLAKMRGTTDGPQPQLGGVYPLRNVGQAFAATTYHRKHFILGDFFVVDKSTVRFDTRMSLKEDYDFTCSHLKEHGAVLRCNRMIIQAKHETNAGGACSIRDPDGERERYNINILQQKWPGVFTAHPTRSNQVVLRWGSLKPETEPAAKQEGVLASAEVSASPGTADVAEKKDSESAVTSEGSTSSCQSAGNS